MATVNIAGQSDGASAPAAAAYRLLHGSGSPAGSSAPAASARRALGVGGTCAGASAPTAVCARIRKATAFARGGSVCAAKSKKTILFQTRPVFPFAANWAQTPAKRFSYELNERLLGFAAPRYERLQSHTLHGFDFDVLLEAEADLDAFDDFTSELRGRLDGFWVSSPFDVFQIEPGIASNSTFLIPHQGLADTFEDHPSQYVIFTKRDQPAQIGKIGSVAASSDRQELVTLDTALDVAIDHTWDARKLFYARLASDDEEGAFMADHLQTRRIRIVELPTEYETIETGSQPVYLYEFYMVTPGETVNWRFTGLNESISSGADAFTTFPIQHDGHTRSIESEARFSVKSWYDAANPLSLFFPLKLSRPIGLRVYETTYAVPATRELIFHGKVEKADLTGKLITASCVSLLDALGRKFPRMMIQPRCNYLLFSTPCGVDSADHKATVEISDINGKYLTIETPVGQLLGFTGAESNWLALGWLETGSGATYEIRQIDKSTFVAAGVMTLTLNAALNHADVGDQVTIYAGCDRSAAVCRDKFDNFRRWGGHVISPTNPTLTVPQAPAPAAGKK